MERSEMSFLRTFKFALHGILYMLRTQRNARIHLILAGLVAIADFIWHLSPPEWCIIVLAIGLVLSAESFNTAIEKAVDLASPGQHEMAGIAKDVSAGAVLITAIIAVIAGLIIFVPKLFACITIP